MQEIFQLLISPTLILPELWRKASILCPHSPLARL
ncbi:hypothetical protein L345_00236 [Ophiophagus hannah]|uniref:Uncharacterized protein n=1 Tax=Ophiophagus hannah TaxID=8665 RepID=V8PH94_OPHHA|nr:hypothetical protein L345_00236 [Ophiophagus hannah]